MRVIQCLVAACAVTLGSCATGRTAITTEADATLRALEAAYASTPDMTIEGTVKVSGIPATVWYDAIIRTRDSMKITLVGPFGIALGAMSASRPEFEFYKADEDIVVTGEPNRQTYEKLLMIPLDYDELIALLRGEVPRLPIAGEYTVVAEGGDLVYTVDRGSTRERIVVDPVLPSILTYERWTSSPATTSRPVDTLISELAIRYSSFEAFGARQLARRANVDVAGGAQRVSVTIEHVDASIAGDATFDLDIPEGVERRRFRP